MMRRVCALGLVAAIALMTGSCALPPDGDARATSGASTSSTGDATAETPWHPDAHTGADLAELRNRTVFFAHNSVGQNLINGLQAIESGFPVVVGQQPDAPGLTAHATGFNGAPTEKIEAFRGLVDNGGSKAQIVAFKLCYADFEAYTDVDEVFGTYVTVMTALEEQYPDVTFVHVTAPLYAFDASWNNNVQHAFNEKLRATYGALVFDLAAFESVNSAGEAALSRDGVTPALAEEWNSDGSHLNAAGERHLGSLFIAFLAQVPVTR